MLRSVRSVFRNAHVAAENDLNYFFAAAKKLCEAFMAKNPGESTRDFYYL